MRNGNAREYLFFLTDLGLDFMLQCSNYTMKATVNSKNSILNKTYVANLQSKRTFAAFAKIKSDIKTKEIPPIKNKDVKYFQHDFKSDTSIPEVWNIDIKSAYATILFNEKYISEDTFKYLCSLTKQERLASVGMLASKKKIFEFKRGNPIQIGEKVAETSGIFFYAVHRTFEIMDELKRICGQNYLFTWVDGIYFKPDEKVLLDCLQALEKFKLQYKAEVLTDFTIKIKSTYIDLKFFKEGKVKIFKLPSADTEFKSILMDATILYNSKIKTNEKSKIKNAY